MIVLGIETATNVCAAAIWKDGHVLAEQQYDLPGRHAEMLPEMIRSMMASAGCQFEDLGGVSVSRGPGSFAGLRIGLAAAKGIAFAHEVPLIGIATPDAIANGIAPFTERLIIVLPSRKGEVYAAPYRTLDGFYCRAGKIVAVEVREFKKWAARTEHVAGPGCPALHDAGVSGLEVLPPPLWQVSAGIVARLGARRLLGGEADDLATLEPEYVKAFHTTARPVEIRIPV